MVMFSYILECQKRIGQITVQGGKLAKFNNSVVPNNSMGGANCSKQIIVQCKKVTSIFVFFITENLFTRHEAKASLGLAIENYADRCVFCFFSAEYA